MIRAWKTEYIANRTYSWLCMYMYFMFCLALCNMFEFLFISIQVSTVLHLVSSLMNENNAKLEEAQLQDKTCSRWGNYIVWSKRGNSNFKEKSSFFFSVKLLKGKNSVVLQLQFFTDFIYRLLNVVEELPKHMDAPMSEFTENVVIETMQQPLEDFPGVTCMAYSQIFSCQDRYINQSIAKEVCY